MVVARVWLNQLDAAAYTTCFTVLFHKVKELCSTFVIGKSLVGIVADWSDTQIKGLEGAIGEETVAKVMKGCQVSYQVCVPNMCYDLSILIKVHFMRSVKRVGERLKECSVESRQVFVSLGYAILEVKTKEEVDILFKAMCGETGLEGAIHLVSKKHEKYATQHNPMWWTASAKWVEWWRRPKHLSELDNLFYTNNYYNINCLTEMLSATCADMSETTFQQIPNSTNAVESYNRLCKGSSPDPLEVAMMTTYKLDMAAAMQHLAVLSGMTVTYERQTPEARSVRSSAQGKARNKRRFAKVVDDAQGPPDKISNFSKY